MEYVSIRTATLRGDQKITFDAYVMIGGKYITFVRQGDSFEGARLDRLKKKKVKKMFIQMDQEKAYRNYLSQNIDQAYDRSSNRTIENRAEVIQGAQQSNAEAIMENPGDQAAYSMAKEEASRYVEFLLKEKEAVRAMLKVENTDHDIAHHGVAVSTLSVAIAGRVGLGDERLTQMLALGALIHDFGHIEANRNVFQPLSALEPSLRVAYMRHPLEGSAKVQDKRHFDSTVIQIIAQHEELINGTGYPQKLQENATDPLAVIVSTANDFDRYVLYEKLNHAAAVKKFLMERIGLHPLDQMKALSAIT